jgi:hypothetical protein
MNTEMNLIMRYKLDKKFINFVEKHGVDEIYEHLVNNMDKCIDYKNEKYNVINWKLIYKKKKESDKSNNNDIREKYYYFIGDCEWLNMKNKFNDKDIKWYCDTDVKHAKQFIFPFFDLKHIEIVFTKQKEYYTYDHKVYNMYNFTYKSDDINIIVEIDNNGDLNYAFIQQNNNFLAVNTFGCHPAVFTNDFIFGNSDGNTDSLGMNGINFFKATDCRRMTKYVISIAKMLLVCQYH